MSSVLSIAAIPVTVIAMTNVVGNTAQVSNALGDDATGAQTRIRTTAKGVLGLLCIASLLTGDTEAMIATLVTSGITYLAIDKIMLST